MNENVKAFISFLAGAVIAGVGVWFYQDKRLSNKFLKEIEEYKARNPKEETECDAKEVTETGSDADADNKDSKGNNPMNIPESVIKASSDMRESVKRNKEERLKKKNITQYSSLTRQYDTRGREHDSDESEVKKVKKPYYISADDYWDIDASYVKYELYYDERDDEVYQCDNNQLFEDYQHGLGYDILDDLKLKGEDMCPIYVRNDETKELYCVDYGFMGYSDERSLK